MKHKFQTVVTSLVILVSSSGIIGCGDGKNSPEARIRILHASPDAPNVDVLVDGGRVLEDAPYTADSGFLPVDAGRRHIAVNAAGTDTAVIDAAVDLIQDTDYLIVAAGKVADIAPIVATVERSEIPAASARIRVLHAAASASPVDVYVTASGDSIASAQPVLSGVPFRAISDYLTVPVGSYDIRVTLAGTKTVAIEALGFPVDAGLRATVAALDAAGGGAPFTLQVVDEE